MDCAFWPVQFRTTSKSVNPFTNLVLLTPGGGGQAVARLVIG
jgi:hypothetical protein